VGIRGVGVALVAGYLQGAGSDQANHRKWKKKV
jgi:hypothetical protein